MRFQVITLFPEGFRPLVGLGVTGRAISDGRVQLELLNPRDFAQDRHRTVDDRPYGGGPGMVMKVEPLRAAIQAARRGLPGDSPCVVMSAQGRVLDEALVQELAARRGLVLVAGRYEGPDERLIELEADYEVSIGDFVLTGGELPAMVVADAVARRIPGVLGDADSASQDSFAEGLLDCPHYTRPERVGGLEVPPVLLSGDHAAIRRWRLKQSLGRTWQRRPELLEKTELNTEQRALLEEFIAEARAGGND
jgi:tRNA (guanine37-N1)-methyltransferase